MNFGFLRWWRLVAGEARACVGSVAARNVVALCVSQLVEGDVLSSSSSDVRHSSNVSRQAVGGDATNLHPWYRRSTTRNYCQSVSN